VNPFFIVGNDRSGTTMLRLIVDRGADAAVPPESMFLTDFAAGFDAGGPRDAQAAAELMREVWRHPKVRLWGLAPQAPAVPPELSGREAYRFIVAAPFEAYAARHGKQRWGDKTPHYVHHVDHLLRLWPRARERSRTSGVSPSRFSTSRSWPSAASTVSLRSARARTSRLD